MDRDLRDLLWKAGDLVACCDLGSLADQGEKQNCCAPEGAISQQSLLAQGTKENIPPESTADRRPPPPTDENTVRDLCICLKGVGASPSRTETTYFTLTITTEGKRCRPQTTREHLVGPIESVDGRVQDPKYIKENIKAPGDVLPLKPSKELLWTSPAGPPILHQPVTRPVLPARGPPACC